MHLLGLLGRGCQAGTNRPHRFIGNHELLIRRGQRGAQAIDLSSKNLLGHQRLPISQRFSHTDDRNQSGSVSELDLRRELRIGLIKQGAPLGMADQNPGAGQVPQHRRRDFACVGAIFKMSHILRTPAESTPGQPSGGETDVGVWRAHTRLDASQRIGQLALAAQQPRQQLL